MSNKLKSLEKKLKINFKDKVLFENAFIHRSYLNEHKNFHLPSNEKLEFLGDSVLSLITSVYLFKRYPELKEGDYTDIKSSIVKTESLADAALSLDLGRYLYLSKGEEDGHGRSNKNILADSFEALIAVIFIDRGFDAAYDFVVGYLFQNRLNEMVESKNYLSPKSKLQELFQRKFRVIPVYKVLAQKGPEHKRIFTIGVFLGSKRFAIAQGKSKKEAEENAAKKVLTMI